MALGYVSFAQQVYQTSSLLRPAAINELDALNRSQVYTLPAADALLKVGLALESYENRLSFFRDHQDLFKPLVQPGRSLEQSFEVFNRDAFNLVQPALNKASSDNPYLKLELTYPASLMGLRFSMVLLTTRSLSSASKSVPTSRLLLVTGSESWTPR